MGHGFSGTLGPTSTAMAAAGCLGLGLWAVSAQPGVKQAKQRCQASANVKAALQYLGWVIRTMREPDGNIFYLLWSMERVGVFYDVKEFAGADWYPWGAEWLVNHQSDNGGWQGGKYAAGHCDTSFALLFLKRANLAKDLTDKLEGIKRRPPSQSAQ